MLNNTTKGGKVLHNLSIDLETYSSVPLKTAGLRSYVRSDDFEILLVAYSLDGAPVEVIDLAQNESLPYWFADALVSDNYIKHAYNAAFEWACLKKEYGYMGEFKPSQWRCTMLHGLYAGYTRGLEATGAALGLPEEKQKLSIGKRLISYFCVPCKPTKTNGGRTRNYPYHDKEKWDLFKEYNRQDVVTEMVIEQRLSAFPVPEYVQNQWETDLLINDRGVAVDMDFVEGALELGAEVNEELTAEAKAITHLQNPNSVKQLAAWLEEKTDTTVDSLNKTTVTKMLEGGCTPEVERVLKIRQELGKTSNKKYDAIETAVCSDGRVHDLLQFYGANRTGRWAGRLVQVQNLPRTYTPHLDLARKLVKQRNKNALRAVYGEINDTLSQLIRTAFIAPEGKVLIDADFSAIEARVISWLAGEDWRLDVFRQGGDIYCASASQMFHCNVVKGGENGHLRQKGKVAELALGYQGNAPALISMGALDMGLSEDELPDIVDRWRKSNSRICALWYSFNDAAITVIKQGGSITVAGCTLSREYDYQQGTPVLTIELPSKRKLYYVSPSIETNRWGGPSITYMGVSQTTKKWSRVETYGGKLVENCVQAIARDCLAEAIERLEAKGYTVVFHVHDEGVIETDPYADDSKMLADVASIMSEPVSWAPGLPLDADGWVGKFFKKD